MITANELQDIIGLEFFEGNLEIAGVIMYIVILALMFVFIKNRGQAMILALPVTMVFSMMGILAADVTILLLIVIALALAFNAKRVF